MVIVTLQALNIDVEFESNLPSKDPKRAVFAAGRDGKADLTGSTFVGLGLAKKDALNFTLKQLIIEFKKRLGMSPKDVTIATPGRAMSTYCQTLCYGERAFVAFKSYFLI